MQQYARPINLRLTERQFKECLENGGVSTYVRWLIDQSIATKYSSVCSSKRIIKAVDERRLECGY